MLPVKLVHDREFLYSSPQGVHNTSFIKASTRTTSRHPEDRSTSYLPGHPLYSMALPDTKRVGRGLIIRMSRWKAHRHMYRAAVCCLWERYYVHDEMRRIIRCALWSKHTWATPRHEQPLATQTTDPHRILEVVLYQWPCPTRSGLVVGWSYAEVEGPSSHVLFRCCVIWFSMITIRRTTYTTRCDVE